MTYKVINEFKDAEDKGTFYEVGDTYPKGAFTPTDERIKALSGIHPKYRCPFIEFVEIEEGVHEAELKAKADEEAQAEAEAKAEGEVIATSSKKQAKAEGK